MPGLFGTDGIRGMANEFPMTGEVAMNVGRAVGYVLQNQPGIGGKSSLPIAQRPLESRKSSRRARVVVGKDTRLANYMIENAIVSGLCSMGVDVSIIGPLSTPGVAFVTKSMRADAGIMISASHNPYHDTGIKLFGADGFKLPDPLEQEIERLVFSKEMHRSLALRDCIGKAYRIEDAIGRYVVFLKSCFPADLDLLGVRIALDCANGGAYKVGPTVFEELGAEVLKRGVSPNGLNINEQCGALHPEAVSVTTMEFRADIGIALDGDGDRCILTDENGELVDGDQIIGLCAIQMAQEGRLKNLTVVTTPMTNYGLELTLQKFGIKMVRVPVGDRHVVEEMKKNGFCLGGEQSGHVIFLDQSTTGDGILAALKVLETMRRSKKPLSELKKSILLLPQVKESVKVSRREPFEEHQEIMDRIQTAQVALQNKGRVFVRYSGTEALARIMVEGEDSDQIQKLSRDIASTIQRILG